MLLTSSDHLSIVSRGDKLAVEGSFWLNQNDSVIVCQFTWFVPNRNLVWDIMAARLVDLDAFRPLGISEDDNLSASTDWMEVANLLDETIKHMPAIGIQKKVEVIKPVIRRKKNSGNPAIVKYNLFL